MQYEIKPKEQELEILVQEMTRTASHRGPERYRVDVVGTLFHPPTKLFQRIEDAALYCKKNSPGAKVYHTLDREDWVRFMDLYLPKQEK